MNDLADQVKSLFYDDMHFEAVNTRMHTKIKCETLDNLMPFTMFSKLFPKVSLDALGRTIEKGITLYAYNNTPIKQYRTCNVRLTFRGRSTICKFFVVEHETAIVGISDSEKLRLVQVNFDVVRDEHVKIINEVKEEAFKQEIEKEYPGLFQGIDLMKGEINIKLKECAIPHVEPVRRVPQAMQELLKAELDKLVKEKILHKVDISEPIEWLDSFCLRKEGQWQNQIVS